MGKSGTGLGLWTRRMKTNPEDKDLVVEAKRLSKVADKASSRAGKSPTSESHSQAMRAHSAAMVAHQALGNWPKAQQHREAMTKHGDEATRLGSSHEGTGDVLHDLLGGGDDRPRDDHGRFASK